MTLDPQLLDILVCPNDRGDLDYRESEQLLVCTMCGYRYPIRDDIPVMLIDEAQKPDQRPDQKPDQKPGRKVDRKPDRKPGAR